MLPQAYMIGKMSRLEDQYAAFVDYMTKERPYLNEEETYFSVCERLRINPNDLDELLLREQGMDGVRIFSTLRKKGM